MIPQWALLFFELWPKQEGCNDRQDLYLRLRYIFGLSVPSMDAQQDNTKFDFKLYESVFNNKIFYRQKKEYILDIGDTLYNSTAFVIYFVVILIVCALFYFLVELVIDWYSISDIFIKIFLYSLISVNIIAYLIIIYFSYYSMEIIAAKFFKPDVKIEQLREYRDALKQSIGKRQVINFAGIVIDGDIDRSLLEWVQSEESRISDEVKMTLIQKKPIGFKLIWMG